MTIAIVFPGQGSQSVGMLADLSSTYPEVKEVFEEASTRLGYNLWKLVLEGPATELDRTVNTQPAMLAAGYACWRVWQSAGGPNPEIVAGHSLGEYTALVCAGVLEFADAVSLVSERGRYMQEAVPEGTGAMAAILGLDDEKIIEVCGKTSGDRIVSPANFNAPGQVVISGHADAVAAAVHAAKLAGARRAVVLPVSVPSHCALMRPAAERLGVLLDKLELRDAAIRVVQNSDSVPRTKAGAIRTSLQEQLHQPVYWHRGINRLVETGISRIIECGPGKVLTGLCKRIHPDIVAQAVYDPLSLKAALGELS
ncbi:MAG: [acyl-carrier-protein] S-malonyltransferase [Gammaproteobacteria bacterium RIFCSPLOWO2_02_FULL_56_15]|nr:MAG: [acyl-carrier-protein] S-malonyltransferase [Gammaproteobacteria bacterium RIFCSPLOWO2_02_FULL_56_15]